MDGTETTDENSRPAHWFKPGQTGNPLGRPKGSRHKIEEVFLADLHAAWVEQGSSAIDRMVESHPNEFVRVIASVLPKESVIRSEPLEELSYDQLIERARSLLVSLAPILGVGGNPGSDQARSIAGPAIGVSTVQ